MKKIITIVIVVLAALGFGYFLFKISPQQNLNSANPPFDLTKAVKLDKPLAVTAEDHVMGNAQAKNTFIVYEDFECPACATFAGTVEQVPSKFTDTKVVFRHFPLFQIHSLAIQASLAAEAAEAQGKFWEMYNQLYTNQNNWNTLADPTNEFVKLAGAAGVADLVQFKSDLQSQKYKSVIEKNYLEGVGLSIQGTPTVYFNDKQLELGDINSLMSQAQALYLK